MESYIVAFECAALVVATLIAISSLDDLFVDSVFWIAMAKRRFLGKGEPRTVSPETLIEKPEAPIAIMLPAWQEADVIASMVENAVHTLFYRNYFIFIGSYANDAETILEVEKLAARYGRVRHVRVPHYGPTCKADCLNHIVADILRLEKEVDIEFAGLVLHDSEDVLHPLELHLFNYLLPSRDMIQLPVVSLEQRFTDFVAGTYMDDFAESHAKDLVVRQMLAKSVPSAGVGTCFSRRAIEVMLEAGEPFNTQTLTEDYDVGSRLAKRGLNASIELYPVEFRSRQFGHFGRGPERVGTTSMPLCVREHFPNTFRASYRQKARWILGIALQGWAQLGWDRSIVSNYFLCRDRKALITPTLAVLAYVLTAMYLGATIWSFASGGAAIPIFSNHPIASYLFSFNLFALAARVVQRVYFVAKIYCWTHAFLAVPRMVVLSFINFAASVRAIRIFVGSKFSGNPIAWDKTNHRFPSDEALGKEKRRLGEILRGWDVVSSPMLEKALLYQKREGGMLGDLLVRDGVIDEDVLTEAISTQNQLPRAELNLDMVCEHLDLLDWATMTQLQILPFGISSKGEALLAVAKPLACEQTRLIRSRMSKGYREHIVPQSRIKEILAELTNIPERNIPVPSVPRVHELLLSQKQLKKKELQNLLKDYNVARHGTIGQFLVAKGTITQATLDKTLELRTSLIESRRQERVHA